jgi:hypothetical protein
MDVVIHVWVSGRPKTKGSMEHRGQGHLQRSDTRADGSSDSLDWELLMAYALQRARGETFGPGRAVAVRAVFWLPVPDATQPRCGDLDKLARAAGDAGQRAQAYADDVQIVRFFLDKVACEQGEAPGVLLTIWAPTPLELEAWSKQARWQRDLIS